MIKKVRIKYFESHQDTEIQFGDKLNLIIGQSNSGKSAIIRAIACCVANRWDKQQVRTGHTYCQSYVQTQKGCVQCQRGEGINKWRTYDNKQIREYKSIGNTVPQQVPIILGMMQKNRGQLKELPNFMFQLQKHYMLAQIDGKKATSNLVARMMDNAIGLGGMQDLIKNIATDLSKDKRNLTEITSKISQLKSQIIDETIFKTYQNIIDKIKEIQKETKELEQIYNKVQNSYQFYILKKNQIKKLKETMIELNIQEVEEQFLDIFKKINIVKQFQKLNLMYQKYKYLNDFKLNQILEDFETLRKIANKYVKSKQMYKTIKNKINMYRALKIKIQSQKEQLAKKEQRYQKLKEELGFCPLCQREFEK